MEKKYQLTLRIHRYDPETKRAWIQNYQLTAGRILRFVDLFRQINEEQDPSLAWNSSCEHGQCGSCAVLINGRPMLSCELLVENAVERFGTHDFEIAPLPVAPVIRDLVADLEKAYEKVNRAKPYIITPRASADPAAEGAILPQELEKYVSATRCINCFCCAAACISGPKAFLGPNALLASIIRVMDPREQEKTARLKLLYSEEGVPRCHTARACSFVCPKEIDVAYFIAQVKAGRFNRRP